MITLEQLIDYCMGFPGVTQEFPFDPKTMVFKVAGKMFALVNREWWMNGDERINVKCDPERATELRDQYESVKPVYHMNKKHWNTIHINEEDISRESIFEYINHSYNLVVKKIPQKAQNSRK